MTWFDKIYNYADKKERKMGPLEINVEEDI